MAALHVCELATTSALDWSKTDVHAARYLLIDWSCMLQDWLHDDVTLLTDTGDAQFNAMKLKLPGKAG